eukprot:4450513-Amphidinium_carterae.1
MARRGSTQPSPVGGVPVSHVLRLVKQAAVRAWVTEASTPELPDSTRMHNILHRPQGCQGVMPHRVTVARSWP